MLLSQPASGDARDAGPPSSSAAERDLGPARSDADADGYIHQSEPETELESTSNMNMSLAELGAAVWSWPDCKPNPAGVTPPEDFYGT